jgi:hypothetical protein
MDDSQQEKKVNFKYNVVPFPQKKEEKGEGFKGLFNNLKLSDLIQLSAQGRMSLILHITQDGREGKIYIHEGEIIHASSHKKTGVEAFFEIMSWKKGEFRSEAYIPPPIQSITLPWEHLLIEAHRWMDEKEAKSSSQQMAKVLPLENIPDEILENLREWAAKHPDVAEMGIFSSAGVKEVYHQEGLATSATEIIEVFHAIPESSRYLCEAFFNGACSEIVINGTEGTIIILFLKEEVELFVHIQADISQKAILRLDINSLIADVQKKLKSVT